MEYVYLTPIQENLVKALSVNGGQSRRDLVSELSTPWTTIYDNLVKLENKKIVEKYSFNDGLRGRPLTMWKLTKKVEIERKNLK